MNWDEEERRKEEITKNIESIAQEFKLSKDRSINLSLDVSEAEAEAISKLLRIMRRK